MPNKIPWKSMINDWQLDERRKKEPLFSVSELWGQQ